MDPIMPSKYRILKERSEITAAENKLRQVMQEAATWTKKLNVGYQGGQWAIDISWIPAVGLWFSSEKVEN